MDEMKRTEPRLEDVSDLVHGIQSLEMEEVKRSGPCLEDVVDLVHHIQSLLSIKEATRTCVLSKLWKQAWYTIPTLRFDDYEHQEIMHFIEQTLSRYNEDNVPIKSIDLGITIEDQESSSLANKCIRTVATQRCLKELSLKIYNSIRRNFILTDEIFSRENLHRLEIESTYSKRHDSVCVTQNPVINCVSLRVLKLYKVKISDEVLNNLFSTCTLLEKIRLIHCTGFTKIKIKNLRYLQKFKLAASIKRYKILEVDDVPNLQNLKYFSLPIPRSFNFDSLSRVVELRLFDVMIDVAFADNIKSKLPFLESLDLRFCHWSPKRLDITSASLKKLSLMLLKDRQIDDLQVSAPKLIHLFYKSPTIPNLSFQNHTTPGKIQLGRLELGKPTDNHCLNKMREFLNLSSEFDIGIRFDFSHEDDVLDMDIDDLETRFPFPATNVHKLSFDIFSGEGRVHPSYFDALFRICHPNYITTNVCNSYSSLLSELMKRKTLGLKHIELKNPRNNKWEGLTDTSPVIRYHDLELKLNWGSL
ncbi:F-box/LRR-repeat protein At5g02910-like [Rutidosis leptorrhynchoides]|uniref:F-box/LRR-repeat protein At5g02910-like n=1 Tax=Rutidosis leptorrhynchoides TaxID=125765 RepID=UPI003A99EC6F